MPRAQHQLFEGCEELFEALEEDSEEGRLPGDRVAYYQAQADQELSVLLAALLATNQVHRKTLGISWKHSSGPLLSTSPKFGSLQLPSAAAAQ